MKRSYRQNCALAHALDIVGDRWTLLIVRELMLGKRRYGELADNLIGLGTNLLADRLRQLQDSAIVHREEDGYTLSDAGHRLEPVVLALIRFGLATGTGDSEDYLTRPEWDAVALKALFRPETAAILDGRYALELDGQAFLVDKGDETLRITLEDSADVQVRVSLRKSTARALGEGKLRIRPASSRGLIKIDGPRRLGVQLLQSFGLGN